VNTTFFYPYLMESRKQVKFANTLSVAYLIEIVLDSRQWVGVLFSKSIQTPIVNTHPPLSFRFLYEEN
jgi:hypothetical protein